MHAHSALALAQLLACIGSTLLHTVTHMFSRALTGKRANTCTHTRTRTNAPMHARSNTHTYTCTRNQGLIVPWIVFFCIASVTSVFAMYLKIRVFAQRLRNHRAMLEVFEEVQQHAEIHAGTGSHIFTQAGTYQPPDEA